LAFESASLPDFSLHADLHVVESVAEGFFLMLARRRLRGVPPARWSRKREQELAASWEFGYSGKVQAAGGLQERPSRDDGARFPPGGREAAVREDLACS